MKKRRYRTAWLALAALLACLVTAVPQRAQAAAWTGEETEVALINTLVGRYQLNYTGGTCFFDIWTTNNTRDYETTYNDLNGPYQNSSTAALKKTEGATGIRYAFLVWETREPTAASTPVGFVTPDGRNRAISPQYAINDLRLGSLRTLYCMAADVTSLVQSAGYGNYSVYNIPRWQNGVFDALGRTARGESLGSWQLIVVEEGDSFPVRVVTMNMGAKAYIEKDFQGNLQLGSGLRTSSVGNVSGQVLFGASNSHDNDMSEVVTAYRDGGALGTVTSHVTDHGGLYRNGSLFNGREGTLRMDLSDVSGIANGADSVRLDVKNTGWTTFFFFGIAVDIAYPDFIGEQTTTVESAKKVTVSGRFTNTARTADTGIYNGNLTVTLDAGLTAVRATATAGGTTVNGTVSGNTVTFAGPAVASMMNGSSIRYTVECATGNFGRTRFDNHAGFHGYLRSEGVNTGYWIDRLWTASSFAVPKYTLTLQKGEGIEEVTGDGSYSYGERVTVKATPKRGWHWKGWTGSYVTAQQDYSFTMPAGDLTLKAEGEANTYTIRFDANGGGERETLPEMTVHYDDAVSLPDGAQAYVKYTLDGVNITQDVLSGAVTVRGDGSVALPGMTPDVPQEAAEDPDGEASADRDADPVPDRHAYASVYRGWSLEEGRYGFEPQWEPVAVTVKELAGAAGVEEANGAVITLYAVWDDSPWLTAVNLYYTLEEAQSGQITEAEILSHASAADREDGSPIAPGIHEDGTSFTIPDYLPGDFTQFTASGSCTENLTVVDSMGSAYAKQITVHVVDTSPQLVRPAGTTRFITEHYYNQDYANGGLAEDSLWKTDPEYAAVIQEAFRRSREDDPVETYYFTHEQILAMQEYVDEHGIGNSREEDALYHFYERFLIPNLVQ